MKRLNDLKINIEDFYCVTVSEYSINLQGEATSEKIKHYTSIFGKFDVDGNGFLTHEGIDVKITFTI